MTTALAPRLGRGIRCVPYLAFTAVIVTALMSSVGIASSSLAQRDAGPAPAIEPPAVAEVADAPIPAVAAVRKRTRCTGCGVVEGIEPLEIVADQPAQFRFTVRMRDRSVRVSRSVGRANWKVGDHIMLIGGARPD